jgi:CRISPR-associated protein Cas1
MKQHLNTLFVTTDGAYLAKEGQSVVVRVRREPRLRVPVHNIGGIVCFGRVSCSPAVMGLCTQAGVAISFLTPNGRLLGRVSGFTPGNVLLRREQYRRADNADASLAVARNIVAAKIANARNVLLRAARDHPQSDGVDDLRAAAGRLGHDVHDVQHSNDLDRLRGLEGDSARTYFSVFNALIIAQRDDFVMNGRTRRPPRDNVNALLSFLYSMLTHDARSACETVGLDPAVGYLHRDRPGRPGLALDLIEELRAFLADRVALSLINRNQVRPSGFTHLESGAVAMTDDTRKTVITEYQKRKQETIMHPFLNEKVTVGLLVHLQARLLARYLRGELDAYPPFVSR